MDMARLKIREVAEAKGYSMGRLQRDAGVTMKVIQRVWRNPDHDISFTTLKKIAAALQVPLRDLIEEDDPPHTQEAEMNE